MFSEFHFTFFCHGGVGGCRNINCEEGKMVEYGSLDFYMGAVQLTDWLKTNLFWTCKPIHLSLNPICQTIL